MPAPQPQRAPESWARRHSPNMRRDGRPVARAWLAVGAMRNSLPGATMKVRGGRSWVTETGPKTSDPAPMVTPLATVGPKRTAPSPMVTLSPISRGPVQDDAATDDAVGAVGLFATDKKKSVAGYALGGVLGGLFGSGDAKDYKFDLTLDLQHYKGKTSVATASTDLGGDKLVIPGLGVGANGNGYVLDSFGGLNTVKDAMATRSFNITSGGISFGVTKEANGSGFRLAVGVGYEDQQQDANFWAKVPGFVRDIMYEQRVSGDIWNFSAEGSAKVRLSEDFRLALDVSAVLRQGSYVGTNLLKFSGFPDQMVDDKVSKTGFGANLGAELEWKTGRNTSLKLRGDYNNVGSMPVWSTPGGGAPSQIEFGKASSIGGGLIGTIRF